MDSEKSAVRQKGQKTQKGRLAYYGEISQWFQTLCFIKIPIFGFLYILVLVLRKSTPREKRSFAVAFLMYRVLVLILALTILYVLYRVGLSFIDEILRYAGGL